MWRANTNLCGLHTKFTITKKFHIFAINSFCGILGEWNGMMCKNCSSIKSKTVTWDVNTSNFLKY